MMFFLYYIFSFQNELHILTKKGEGFILNEF